MIGSEVRALGSLAATALAAPAGLARDVHRAAARRVFAALGPLGAPARLLHDAIAAAAYDGVHAGLRLLPSSGGTALAALPPPDAAPLAESLLGGMGLGALNGAFGDRVAREHPALALDFEIHARGEAGPRLAVFVHGLCETDDAWRLGGRPPYGSLLRDELGYTPLYVRYNTGLHVSDNGRRLSQALEDATRAWPVEVEEIALVGHSMGGLVARSACHYGHAADAEWTRRLRHVFCLGTPHLGAPLEQAANVAGWALGRLPETRPFASALNARSAGIKDLRFGSCVEEDWCDCDPDEFLRDRCTEVPFLPMATYYFIGATLSRSADGPLARTVGDLFVLYPSASGAGRRRRIPFEVDNGRHLGGLNHFQLLNHPAVYEQIRSWLAREPAALSSRAPA